MAFLFSGGRKDEGDISKLRRSVDKLMKEGNIKQVIDNIESTVLEAGSTKKVEDIKWALRTTELIVNHIFQTAGKINFDLANDDSQTELIRLIWDLPTLKGAWDLYHQGLKGGSLIDAGIMGQFGARMEEKGAQRPDIKERLEVSGEALDTIAKCAVSIGEISIKSESSFFTTEMMFGIAMDCWKRLNNPNKFAETETRFAQVERFLADVLERDGQPYTAERARKIANKEEELAKLILSRGIIETREEHNEKVYGKLVEIVPMGAWLAAERVAEYMDIDRNGHYDLRATQLFSPEWGTST
ncbi:MAG: hypothetical protein KGH61_04395, partial [Candidatus Micrarchaeota archaeon]|nr:hypothetical protein [Candidatus Micrarchaeota archaeon]